MDNIYRETTERAKKGHRVSIDFKRRTLRINGGNVDLSQGEHGIPRFENLDDWLDHAEYLYDAYKYSTPSKVGHDMSRHKYFRALTDDELIAECGHNAFSTPVNRYVAQTELELFILLSLVSGAFNPDELFAKDWFYQGVDKSFILCKHWF